MYRSMWAVSVLLAGVAAAGTVDDPIWVREAVRVSFPGAVVRESTREVWEQVYGNYPDPALFRKPAYYFEVIGKAEDREEGFSISVTGEEPESRRRLVKAQFIVGASGRERRPVYVGLFTYTFLGVTHCEQCWYAARVSLLEWRDGRWRAETEMVGGGRASVKSARFLDLTGDDEPELLVEVDGGGNLLSYSYLCVFSVSGGHLQLLGEVETRFASARSGFNHQHFDTRLDVAKTRATGGRELVFRVTTWWRKGVRLPAPEVSEERVAVKRGGVPAAAPSMPAR
ncbi:MAG: hypothetical protein J0L64_10610 [Acidobacteria bacterium]|nr:hypothetical protein [Acidobacteriota bacterium]